MESVDKMLVVAVTAALSSLDLTEADNAAVKLAELYARQIDDAKQAERHADRVLSRLDDEDDPDLIESVRMLRLKLSAKVTLSDLGPRLLATLETLGASPKARSQISKAAPTGPRNGALAGLRAVVGGE